MPAAPREHSTDGDYANRRATKFYDLVCNQATHGCRASAAVAEDVRFNDHVVGAVDGKTRGIAPNTVSGHGDTICTDIRACGNIDCRKLDLIGCRGSLIRGVKSATGGQADGRRGAKP